MNTSPSDEFWMQHALRLAQYAQALGEVPIGAVLVQNDQIIGQGYNCPIATHDPTAHAEIQAIRAACASVQNYRLGKMILYVTLEPCAMCAGAIIQARISQVVFAARDPRAGAGGSVFNVLDNSQLNHRVKIIEGVLMPDCSQLLKKFFQTKRVARAKEMMAS